MHSYRIVAFAISLAACSALAAACGPSTPTPVTADGTGDGTGDGAGEGGGATGGTPDGGPADGGGVKPGSPAPAPAGGAAANVEIKPSGMLADVQKIGIDLKKAPEIGKIKLGDKKKLMPFFQKSLGFDACTGCHASETDYKTETKNIRMARNMWKYFIVQLRDDKGGPIFCDSCHNGKQELLNRSDKQAVEKFMEANYEHKLSRADGENHGCATCHGDYMELKIFEKMWNVK